ncbi:MAG: hypothetical protein IPM29_25895 [Planctomycetes bacterium]|nr:hypothetical protein [Planctomycetota bacterium]
MPGAAVVALRILLVAGACSTLAAQSLGEIRDEIRQAVRQTRYVQSVIALVDFSQTATLAGARYWLDDDTGTQLDTLVLPWDTDVELAGTDLRIEGQFGWLSASAAVTDLFSGALPGVETAVDTRWDALSGSLGIGPRLQLGERTHVAVLGRVAAAWLHNDATYSGPGAGASAVLFDDILFNWSSTIVSGGLAVQLDRRDVLAGGAEPRDEIRLESVLRVESVWTATVQSSDSTQDVSDDAQMIATRLDVVGPTGWTIGGQRIDWRGWTGWTHFPGDTGDRLDFANLFQLGAGLEAELGDVHTVPFDSMSASAAFLFGDGILGISAGFGVEF